MLLLVGIRIGSPREVLYLVNVVNIESEELELCESHFKARVFLLLLVGTPLEVITMSASWTSSQKNQNSAKTGPWREYVWLELALLCPALNSFFMSILSLSSRTIRNS